MPLSPSRGTLTFMTGHDAGGAPHSPKARGVTGSAARGNTAAAAAQQTTPACQSMHQLQAKDAQRLPPSLLPCQFPPTLGPYAVSIQGHPPQGRPRSRSSSRPRVHLLTSPCLHSHTACSTPPSVGYPVRTCDSLTYPCNVQVSPKGVFTSASVVDPCLSRGLVTEAQDP